MDPPHPTAIKNSLEGDSQAELESPDSARALAYPDVSSTYDPKTRRVFLNMLNRSEKQDIAAQISSVSGAVSGSANIWELNHTDLKATHTFANDKLVRPVTRTFQPAAQEKGFGYAFPKHSLTILTLQLK